MKRRNDPLTLNEALNDYNDLVSLIRKKYKKLSRHLIAGVFFLNISERWGTREKAAFEKVKIIQTVKIPDLIIQDNTIRSKKYLVNEYQ